MVAIARGLNREDTAGTDHVTVRASNGTGLSGSVSFGWKVS